MGAWCRNREAKKLRLLKLIKRDGEGCQLCFKRIDFSISKGDERWTVDHILPIAFGGKRKSLKNIRLAHYKCNHERSNVISLLDLRLIIERRLIEDKPHPFWLVRDTHQNPRGIVCSWQERLKDSSLQRFRRRTSGLQHTTRVLSISCSEPTSMHRL